MPSASREETRQKEADLVKALEAKAALEGQLTVQGELIKTFEDEVKLRKTQAKEMEKRAHELLDGITKLAEGYAGLKDKAKNRGRKAGAHDSRFIVGKYFKISLEVLDYFLVFSPFHVGY